MNQKSSVVSGVGAAQKGGLSRASFQGQAIDRLLEAAEARGDTANEEVELLRRENESLNSAVERSTRLLSSLRADYDRIKEENAQDAGDEVMALAESVRLRSQMVELEREVKRLNERADDSDKKFMEEKKRSSALERVCMDLRRRVAMAEEKAADGRRVQEAILARELAEAQLAEVKVQAEQWRAKSCAAEVAKERAEASERSERVQRERISALEKEVESREGLLRQATLERKRLQVYMGKYERELEEKEAKLTKLRGWVRERGGKHTKTKRRARTEIELERALDLEDETEGTDIALSLEKENMDDNDETLEWDDLTADMDQSRSKPGFFPNESATYAEPSPLRREVEEAHAQLEAAFKERGVDKTAGTDPDLVERVRRMEVSLGAIAQKIRSPSAEQVGQNFGV